MKLTVFQPPYPQLGTPESAQECINWIVEKLQSQQVGNADLIVLPEYSNSPGLEDPHLMREFAKHEGALFLENIEKEATRLKCLIAIGTLSENNSNWVNRTFVFGPENGETFLYDKIHLTDMEINILKLKAGSKVSVFEDKGVRLGFAVCFDLYFSEYFSAIAAQNTDIIICPSYQRSELGDRICLISQTRALDSGCYLIRSSYAIEGSRMGGHSLVASPEGDLLANAGTEPGILKIEIDPAKKFVKPRSYKQPLIEHRVLTERHRQPTIYRQRMERDHSILCSPFPRLCSHRGISLACPENTLPAFGSALSLGVHEIELDVWMTHDGEPVICHDSKVDRTTNGKGLISEMKWTDIKQLDAGIKTGPEWRGIRVPHFREVVELIDNQAILNIHIKNEGPNGKLMKKICDFVNQYNLLAYISGSSQSVLQEAKNYGADIERACLKGQHTPSLQIELAQKFDCLRIQFGRVVKEKDIKKAHELGLVCNLFYSDDPTDAVGYLQKGIDVVLTNCANILFETGHFIPLVKNIKYQAPYKSI